MKKIGIIGGLGPETSAKFQLEIIASCLKNNRNQRPPILSWNVPVLLKVEKELITKNGDEKEFLPLLKETAIILEKAGVDFLVMPCNTLHIFIEDIRKTVNVPMLSIIDETIKVLIPKKIKRVGLLATSKTISKNLFGNKLKDNGIEQIILNKTDQADLNTIIHRAVTNNLRSEDRLQANAIVTKMAKKGTKNILLACTDLQLIIEKYPQINMLDTMQILAEASANEILKGGEEYE